MKNTAKQRGETHGVQDGGCGVHLCRGKRCGSGGSSAGIRSTGAEAASKSYEEKLKKQIDELEDLQRDRENSKEYIADNYSAEITHMGTCYENSERVYQDIDYYEKLVKEYILGDQDREKFVEKLMKIYSPKDLSEQDFRDEEQIWYYVTEKIDDAIAACRIPRAEYYTENEETAVQFLAEVARSRFGLATGKKRVCEKPLYFESEEQCSRIARKINKLLKGTNISARAVQIEEYEAHCGEPFIYDEQQFEDLIGFRIKFSKKKTK